MKRIYYTTTEFTTKPSYQDQFKEVVDTSGEEWIMFRTKKAAQADVDWIKLMYSGSAYEYFGPKVVKITLEVLKK